MDIKLLTHNDVINIIDRVVKLPDEAVVDPGLAALFLGISEKSLSRYRQDGDGPPYVQYHEKGAKSRNQKVHYEMGELRSWRNQHRVTSTMDGAIRRGMCFARVNDLLTPHPFWQSGKKIISHALDCDRESFAHNLQNPENRIVWLSWPKVFDESWLNTENQEKFRSAYIALLSKLLEAANSHG